MSNDILIHQGFFNIHIKFPDIHVKTSSLTNASMPISCRLFHIWKKKSCQVFVPTFKNQESLVLSISKRKREHENQPYNKQHGGHNTAAKGLLHWRKHSRSQSCDPLGQRLGSRGRFQFNSPRFTDFRSFCAVSIFFQNGGPSQVSYTRL